MSPTLTTDEVLARVRVLHRKLEDEGMYVRANTVFLAIEEIVRLRCLIQAHINPTEAPPDPSEGDGA